MFADLAIGSPRTYPAIGSPRVRIEAGQDAEALHLAPGSLPRWRALLEFHWRTRLERVTELSLAYHDAKEHGEARGHGGDGPAVPDTEARARPLLRQAVAERRALAEIEAALTRVSAGTFGRCERCGSAVSATRLTRIPQARYCAACDR
jgi:RNA polymerase-binding transcription factor DksA